MINAECDCSVDTCDGDPCEFASVKKVTARKEHQCCECDRTILKGETYEYVSGVWSGKFSTYKTCLRCIEVREKFCPDGFFFGELKDTIKNCLGFDYTEVPELSVQHNGVAEEKG